MTTIAGLLIKQGDDLSKALTVTNAAGAALDISGATLTFHLRAPGATTDSITPAPTLALTSPTAGVATLTLTAAQTAALTAGTTYTYEIELLDATTRTSTPVEGLALVTGDLG